MRTAKTLIRLGGCPGRSESSLGTQIILLVLSCHGSYAVINLIKETTWEVLGVRIQEKFSQYMYIDIYMTYNT